MDINDVKSIIAYNASSIPVLFEMCRIAKIAETVNDMVEWKSDNAKVSPGFLIEVLVVTIMHRRQPLWKIEEYWRKQKLEFMLEDSGITVEQLNDDAFARALDKLQTVNMKELVSRICLNMLKAHNLTIESLHLDTTSISVEGLYEVDEEDDFIICYGYSKDNRPDLKQFKIGAAVQQSGLPVMGQLLSGNKSDREWNPEAIKEMKVFFEGQQYRDIIFVGDSATVSSYESLRQLEGIRFISRLPENFSCVSEWKEKAWQGVNWEEVGTLSESSRKGAAEYRIYEFVEAIDGKPYRFVLVHTNSLREQKIKTLQKRWEKEKRELEKEAKSIGKRAFACVEDAMRESAAFMEKVESLHYNVEAHIEEKVSRRYSRRGRPGTEDRYEETVSYYVKHTIGERDDMACEKDLFMESTFVLITSVMDREKYPGWRILAEYKGQSSIEQAFKFLKSPVYLGPVYLKKPERVEAMGYVFILVLLIASYLEYRVRKALRDRGEYYIQPNGQKSTRPSVRTILEVLETVLVIYFNGNLYLPNDTSPKILKMLEWLGFSPDIYTRKINPIF